MSKVKAVIFDMDGVLIDSEPFWHKGELETFPKVGVHISEGEHLQTTGLRIDEVVKYWHSRFPWDNPSLKEIEKAICEVVKNKIRTEGKPMKGVIRILDTLSTNGYKVALASSSSYEIIHTVTDSLGITDKFQVIHSAEDEEFGKPHPQVFISAARKLEVEPTDCLVFEDSFFGMVAALAARMQVVVVPALHEATHPRFGAAHARMESFDQFIDSGMVNDFLSFS